MGILKHARKNSAGWQAGGAAGPKPLRGLAKLRGETARVREQFGYRLRLLFPATGGGISGRLLTYAEVAADLSQTPLGRVVTATASLTLAFLLIPSF